MIPAGAGCGLQIRRTLTGQRFDSSLQAAAGNVKVAVQFAASCWLHAGDEQAFSAGNTVMTVYSQQGPTVVYGADNPEQVYGRAVDMWQCDWL